MRLCNLTNEQLLKHAANYPVARALEASFAYEHASCLIESSCGRPSHMDESGDWLNLDDVDDMAVTVDEEAGYLASRGLLDHHPANPRWVWIRDESEPHEATQLPGRAVVALGEVADLDGDVSLPAMGAKLALPVQEALQAGVDGGLALGANLVGNEVLDFYKGESSSASHPASLTPDPVDAPVCTETEATK